MSAIAVREPSLEALRRRRSLKWVSDPADVLPLSYAEMDFELAPPIKAVLLELIENGDCGYVPARGGELEDVFAQYARTHYDWAIDPASVVPVPDVLVGIADALRRVTAPGDGVIVNTPGYPPFFSLIEEIGRRVVDAPLAFDGSAFDFDFETIERGFAAGARAMVLCNPHNPTGRVFDVDQLSALATLADYYDAAVVSDEIHAPLVYPGTALRPFVTISPAAAARGIVITSASKGWNIPGLKCAVMVANPGPMQALLGSIPKDAHYRTGYLGYFAACAAWRDGGPWLEEVLGVLDRNRTLLRELLAERLPAIRSVTPEAGYLAWLDCRGLDLPGEPADMFREHGRVGLGHGPDFGPNGAGFVRVNFATSAAIVDEGVARMASAVQLAGAIGG